MTHLWFASALLPDGWARQVRISVADGRIMSVDAGASPHPADERHAIGLPGLCNVHSHGFQRGMAGLAEYRGQEGDDFWSWREIMYRFLDHLGPDDVEAICALAYAEMLEGGFTRVGEFHYLHHDPKGAPYDNVAELAERVIAAARHSGIGLTMLPVFYAHADFGGKPPNAGQRRFINDLDGFARLLVDIQSRLADNDVLGVAPHSLRAVTADELAHLVSMHASGPIHIHAAEQTKEVEACLEFSGQRPVEWLLDNSGIDKRWALIHATHITEAETRRLAQSGAVAGLCPVTEANLGDGIFPAVSYLNHRGSIAIGTDSNILIDAPQELRSLEYSQRLLHRGRNLLASEDQVSTGARLFGAALNGGARALGVGTGLAPGQPADMLSLDGSHPGLVGRSGNALLDSWIFGGRNQGIDCVWVAGRKLVVSGRHIDADAIGNRYRKVMEKLLAA